MELLGFLATAGQLFQKNKLPAEEVSFVGFWHFVSFESSAEPFRILHEMLCIRKCSILSCNACAIETCLKLDSFESNRTNQRPCFVRQQTKLCPPKLQRTTRNSSGDAVDSFFGGRWHGRNLRSNTTQGKGSFTRQNH